MTLNREKQPNIKTIDQINIPDTEKIQLDNGLNVHILKGASQDILKVDLLIPAGSIYSNKKLIAPLAGQMLHEGTHKNTAHQIAEQFDFCGAYFRNNISKDFAELNLLSLTKHSEKTLNLFSEVVLNSTFPEKEFEIAKKRRKQNFLIESEKTSFIAKEIFFEQLFGSKHPYGRRTEANMYDNLENNELKNFYKDFYQTGNFDIICSGKIGSKEIELLNKYFGKHTAKPIKNSTNLEINSTYGFIGTKKDNAVQSSIRMGTQTITKNHEDYIGLTILTTILGGYFGSRLMKNIREDKGYTYGIYSMQVSMLNAGYMAIAADVKNEFTKNAIDEIKKEIEKLKTSPVSISELNLVRSYLMGELLQFFDGAINVSEALKGVIPYNLSLNYYKKLVDEIQNIPPDKLQTLANKYFNLDKFVTVVSGKL